VSHVGVLSRGMSPTSECSRVDSQTRRNRLRSRAGRVRLELARGAPVRMPRADIGLLRAFIIHLTEVVTSTRVFPKGRKQRISTQLRLPRNAHGGRRAVRPRGWRDLGVRLGTGSSSYQSCNGWLPPSIEKG
jgi:hypothetical protein